MLAAGFLRYVSQQVQRWRLHVLVYLLYVRPSGERRLTEHKHPSRASTSETVVSHGSDNVPLDSASRLRFKLELPFDLDLTSPQVQVNRKSRHSACFRPPVRATAAIMSDVRSTLGNVPDGAKGQLEDFTFAFPQSELDDLTAALRAS